MECPPHGFEYDQTVHTGSSVDESDQYRWQPPGHPGGNEAKRREREKSERGQLISQSRRRHHSNVARQRGSGSRSSLHPNHPINITTHTDFDKLLLLLNIPPKNVEDKPLKRLFLPKSHSMFPGHFYESFLFSSLPVFAFRANSSCQKGREGVWQRDSDLYQAALEMPLILFWRISVSSTRKGKMFP